MSVSAYFNYDDAHAPVDERIELLSALSEDEWRRLLSHTVQRRFTAGQTIIAMGEHDSSLYIVGDGDLEVTRPGLEQPIVIHAGNVTGEMAFFDAQPRSADVRARTDCTLFELSHERFDVLAAHEPRLTRYLLMELARTLAIRLRRAQRGPGA